MPSLVILDLVPPFVHPCVYSQGPVRISNEYGDFFSGSKVVRIPLRYLFNESCNDAGILR